MKKLLGLLALTLISTNVFAYQFGNNIPPAVKQQMVDDLTFMNQLQGNATTPLHKQIFGDMTGQTYKNFFETRVTFIGYWNCGGGNAVACVSPMRGSSKIWITDNYIKFSHPQISRLMVVYHESRHTETQNGNWGHATCPTPFRDANGNDMKSIWTGAMLAGEPACDVTPLGSYGSSTILLKNVSKFCTNCTAKVKMDAGIYADDQLGRVIDAKAKSAMQKDFGTAIRNNRGQIANR